MSDKKVADRKAYPIGLPLHDANSPGKRYVCVSELQGAMLQPSSKSALRYIKKHVGKVEVPYDLRQREQGY